jgi:hypothetical protein
VGRIRSPRLYGFSKAYPPGIEARRRCITDYEMIFLGRVLKFSPLEIASAVKTRDLLALAQSEILG